MAFVNAAALPSSFSSSLVHGSSVCAAPSRHRLHHHRRTGTPHHVTPRRAPAPVTMHGSGMGSTSSMPTASSTQQRRPGEHKGFVEEMRFIAMRLHTKDQAPREGEQEQSALPIDAWYPSQQDFMQFLIDSRHVYEYFETELIPSSSDDSSNMFACFRNTGLERLEALNRDISYLNTTAGVPTTAPTSAATNYVAYLRALLQDKPESVLCHWYNYYFAHSAGGRMIGRLMQDRLFAGRQFDFYDWGENDIKALLNKVRVVIDDLAKDWPRDVKDECLKETGLAFGYSGTVLQNLAKASSS